MDAFKVNIIGLSFNVHQYHFDLENEFFERFDAGLVNNGHFSVDVTLDKRETFIDAVFRIKGTTTLICDRSLEEFEFPIEMDEHIIFKFGHENREISEELVMIERGTESLELAPYLYEFIGLAIPMKKLHPKFEDESEEDEIIYTSGPAPEENNSDEPIDPRWEVLKKLNKN